MASSTRLGFSVFVRLLAQPNGINSSRNGVIATINDSLCLASRGASLISLGGAHVTLGGAGQTMTFTTSPVSFWSPPESKGHDGLKFKAERAAKYQQSFNGRWVMPLPDYKKAREIKAAASYRLSLEKMKRDGLLPPRQFKERPIDISSTYDVHEPYAPPEGDGVKSMLSKEGTKEKAYRAKMWTKTKNSIRKINKMEKDTGGFAAAYFSEEAVDLYIEAHEALVKGNTTRLHDLVTSKCIRELMHGLECKTLRWRYHEPIEPPRIVNATLFTSGPEGNQFAQVTVRMHSSQSVAIYDRFGRLAYGDPELPRSIIEFVVFEKRMSDTYGTWRMHGKIEPHWLEAKPPINKTFRIPDHVEIHEEDLEKMDAKDLTDEEEDEMEQDKRPFSTQ